MSRDPYLDGIMNRRGATPDEMEAEARVRTTDHSAIPGLASTRKEIASNPELAEVDEMLTEHLNSVAGPPLDQLRSSNQQGLSQYKRTELKIVVWYEYPPIPDRRFDYLAMYEHDDGDSGRVGNGSTPFMAIKDLIDNINPTEEFDSLVESRRRASGNRV